MWCLYGVRTHPKLYKEKGILGAFAKELLQAPLLFGEFIINLTNIHRLQQGIVVGVICLSDVHKEMLVVLDRKRKSG